MIDDSIITTENLEELLDQIEAQSYSEEEVKLLLTERLQRIAEGNAVTIQQEEVKNHIRDSRLIESTLLSK